MSLWRLFAQRVLMGFIAAWAVLTGVFSLFMLTPDHHLQRILALAAFGGGQAPLSEIREGYLSERGLDRPVESLYLDYMVDMFTLDWGTSFHTGEPVAGLVWDAVLTTATYLLPGIALAVLLGLAIGVYTALRVGTRREQTTRHIIYVGFGLPNFWLGAIILALSGTVGFAFRWRQDFIAPVELPFLYEYVIPAALVATTLTAAIASYARAYSLQVASSDVIKMIRAKGGGSLTVAKHVIRNSSIPLFSLLFTETLALLALSVFVLEALFAIDGVGLLFYNAVWTNDIPVIMGATVAVVIFSVAGNVLQDLAYTLLDPRVDTGTR